MKTKADKVKAQPAPFLEKVAGFMPVAKLSQVLDAIGRNKKTDVSELLWGPKTQPANVAKA